MEIKVRNKRNWNGEGFYVGRPSPLSNPFIITDDQTRDICIQRYASLFIDAIQNRNPSIITALQNLESYLIKNQKLNIICHCSPEPCHADLIKQALLNKFHTNYWLVQEKCPTCGHGKYKIGVHGL